MAVLDTACRTFAKSGYRGATTAEIAREAGVTEPILYRHFGSKRGLYLACLGEASLRVRETWELAIEHEPDPAQWLSALGSVFLQLREAKSVLMNLWVQGLAEAGDDPEIRTELRRSLREAHDYIAEVIRRVQAGRRDARGPRSRCGSVALPGDGLLLRSEPPPGRSHDRRGLRGHQGLPPKLALA